MGNRVANSSRAAGEGYPTCAPAAVETPSCAASRRPRGLIMTYFFSFPSNLELFFFEMRLRSV